jgi:DNA-binding LytR/AlgR family response regulator
MAVSRSASNRLPVRPKSESARLSQLTAPSTDPEHPRDRATAQRGDEPLPWPEFRHVPVSSALMPTLLVGERERRFYVLKAETVDYIESHGNYVKLHRDNAEYINRGALKRLASLLAASGFLRIQRGLLVNIHAVLYLERAGRGLFAFTLTSGSRLHSGLSFRGDILRALPLLPIRGERTGVERTEALARR